MGSKVKHAILVEILAAAEQRGVIEGGAGNEVALRIAEPGLRDPQLIGWNRDLSHRDRPVAFVRRHGDRLYRHRLVLPKPQIGFARRGRGERPNIQEASRADRN